MLLYKTWRESRLGFLLSVSALLVFTLVPLLFPHHDPRSRFTYTQEIYLSNYRGGPPRNIFLMLALLLGLGGLQRERANGTVLFTLSLPIRRAKLVAVRAGVALVEMAVLALTPALLLPPFSSWHYGPYPSFSQAFHFSLLWMGAGTVLVAFGLLIATLVPGDYPAAAACIIALFSYVLILNLDVVSHVHSLDLLDVMSGEDMPYFGGRNLCTIAWIPWSLLARYVLVATVLFGVACWIVERQEF